jgi:antitoxin CptB
MGPLDDKRLKWRCRRGLLELDIVLQRFLERHPVDPLFAELLELPDNDLWDIIIGRSERFDARLKGAVERLRAV